jgi:hypothetical protein
MVTVAAELDRATRTECLLCLLIFGEKDDRADI